MKNLEKYFAPFRRNTIGHDYVFTSPYGEKQLIYADWTASGRLYAPIERILLKKFAPLVGNTHSESSITGVSMTQSYHLAQKIIKKHVHAAADDVILTSGSGMTSAINKFQRILGLKLPEQLAPRLKVTAREKPVVFLTHMEHHSNQTTWLETIADVVVVPPDQNGLVDLQALERTVRNYQHRPNKIGSFTACSNVTGIRTSYHDMARIMHANQGLCFVDFAASAPYVDIDMHPADPEARLDAIFFSPHKFLGGPGATGVLVFNSNLYQLRVPDQPGGGTVSWTNPWGQHSYIKDIEIREDGGTPAFLQTIRAALAVRLKEEMGVQYMLHREEEMLPKLFDRLLRIRGMHILAEHVRDRLAVVSFYAENVHYNLFVKLLNDRFGIQVRGGCSCAGTYGHYLLHVDPRRSADITHKIDSGDLSEKPGWVRLSLHPTTTDVELDYIVHAIAETSRRAATWSGEYRYDPHSNEFHHRKENTGDYGAVEEWFRLRRLPRS